MIMDFEKSLLSETFKNLGSYLEKLWNLNVDTNYKDSQESKDYRQRGNKLFLQKVHNDDEHRDILTYYNKSIAYAPMGSEDLAYAYGNRAAFLLHDKKYQECIKDCDRAFELSTSEAFKCKILCRKAESMKKLRLHGCEDVIIEAKTVCDKISDDKSKIQLMVLVDKVKNMSIKNIEQKIYQKSYKITTLPETDNLFDFVRIEYNEKYGRHLVANKDYEPGDVIITEKLYAYSIVKEDKSHSYCHYCLKFLWSGVPCNHCTWAMFCSEECYQEAWEQFHYIECASLSFLKEVDAAWNFSRLSIRILLLSLNKVGSINKLKAHLESIAISADASKDFPKDSKFDGVKSLYFLFSEVSMMDDSYTKYESQIVAKALIGLVKHTNLFENNKIQSFEEFVSNDHVSFLGSLLIKISVITVLNSYSAGDWKFDRKDLTQNVIDETQPHNECLALVSSLFSHSCTPNACRYITEDHKIIIIADYPIKKNSQIFIGYCETFDISTVEDRHKSLEKYYFKCDCQACTENWPQLNRSTVDKEMGSYFISKNKQALDILNTWNTLFAVFYFNEDDYLKKKDLKKLCQAISKGHKHLKKPSLVMCTLIDMLHQNLSQMYRVRPPIFSQCENIN